jgi:hypothetical protein
MEGVRSSPRCSNVAELIDLLFPPSHVALADPQAWGVKASVLSEGAKSSIDSAVLSFLHWM